MKLYQATRTADGEWIFIGLARSGRSFKKKVAAALMKFFECGQEEAETLSDKLVYAPVPDPCNAGDIWWEEDNEGRATLVKNFIEEESE